MTESRRRVGHLAAPNTLPLKNYPGQRHLAVRFFRRVSNPINYKWDDA